MPKETLDDIADHYTVTQDEDTRVIINRRKFFLWL